MPQVKYIINFQKKYTPGYVYLAIEKLIKMKSKYSKWQVIEEILNLWTKSKPQTWRSHLVNVKDIRETRKRTQVGCHEFSGVSYDRKTGGYINYVVDIPEKVILMIRTLYKNDELSMNKKFFREFGRRFPAFKVSGKV